MTIRVLTVIIPLLSLLSADTAVAVLIEADLFAPGDGLLTRDTETGLEWLDVDQTLGLSYDSVAGGAGGWTALGFRHANAEELSALLSAAGVADQSGSFVASNFAGAQAVVALLGCTGSCGTGSDFQSGLVDFVPFRFSEADTPFVQLDSNAGEARAAFGFARSKDATTPTSGNYLVRPIPEPATGLLLVSGLVGLGLRRRRASTS